MGRASSRLDCRASDVTARLCGGICRAIGSAVDIMGSADCLGRFGRRLTVHCAVEAALRVESAGTAQPARAAQAAETTGTAQAAEIAAETTGTAQAARAT